MADVQSTPHSPPAPTPESAAAPSSSAHNNDEALARAKALRQSYLPTRPYVPICPYGTRSSCPSSLACPEVHFQRALRPHTEPALGDCSYLNTCHRMDSCRYVHWVLEDPGKQVGEGVGKTREREVRREDEETLPPQWINADLRSLDVSMLGKFEVVVADPPWAIHQELPYGTLTDDEMMRMPLGSMQDEGGLLFLWVTGRAMELGRDCLAAWGYERIDELVWVKTNQLQGLIRTGRTGHWLNHSKEHCIVAVRKSSTDPNAEPRLPSWFNKGLDTQVILAEVRETSRKPDELYDMVERILGGRGRKVELFGRTHNLRKGWMTIGNQFGSSDQVFEQDIVANFAAKYPERGMKLLDPKTLKPKV
ncbi:MT-A70-domain-containing protein [Leucosporidium creatinivorum]|uniref:mRNA m(6)A methyltransferase n=1 Tax=Leucosporidium creatinivorum TaxID=106004 RepID=A0A1Y2F178_9BASI|nr:MT-A70-domain-containing protein [Leucosporidium creatinivorum]